MLSNSKNIAVYPQQCSENKCHESCSKGCELCLPCVTAQGLRDMLTASREHIRRGDFKRIYPAESFINEGFARRLSSRNQLSAKWFEAKCSENESWCWLSFDEGSLEIKCQNEMSEWNIRNKWNFSLKWWNMLTIDLLALHSYLLRQAPRASSKSCKKKSRQRFIIAAKYFH